MDPVVIKNGLEVAPVSVIIPCFRCADTIERALDSILRQTMLPSEILFVEDLSADEGETLDKLHELASAHHGKINFRVLCMETNGGPGEARNLGWAYATQPYIAFLDADDAWHRSKIEIQYLWMKANQDAVLSCHETIVLSDPERELHITKNHVQADAINAYRMLFFNLIPTRSVMLKNSVNERFAKGMRYAEDYHLWIRIVFSGQQVYRLRLPLAFSFKREFGGKGLSGNLLAMQHGEKLLYKSLLSAGHINYLFYVAAILFSYIKFWRRMLMVAISTGNADLQT
ncbi:MAG: glycosyltransferase family 2 protein [Gammaproteobacteria bacterium]|nr:glycosyltransferase family 2 protein [Gammaproteobacteria bacterium]